MGPQYQSTSVKSNMRSMILFFLVQGAFASDCMFSDVNCAGANEQACNSMQFDDMGCPMMPGYCQPMMSDWETDRNGMACPMYCPVECNWETEMHCPGLYNAMGCRDQDMCVPMGEACPEETFDQRGCPMMMGDDWWLECDEGMMSCSPQYDSMGCLQPAYCAAECTYSGFDDRGCWTDEEPIMCGDNEWHCGYDYDPNGCMIDMGCMPFHTDCPMPDALCPVETDYICPPTYNGMCMDPPMCFPMVEDSPCPADSSCPVNCDWNTEMMCSQAMPDGCSHDYCMPATQPNELNAGTCVSFCPIECNWETEMPCMGLLGADGCRGPETCVPMGEECPVDA